MKLYIILFTLITSITMAGALEISVKISPWVSACSNSVCKTPQATFPTKEYMLPIKELTDEGSADLSVKEFSFDNELSGNLKLYSVFPKSDSSIPPYIQFQFIQKKPVYLFCAHSIKVEIPLNIPPLLCATEYKNSRLGYTITFE